MGNSLAHARRRGPDRPGSLPDRPGRVPDRPGRGPAGGAVKRRGWSPARASSRRGTTRCLPGQQWPGAGALMLPLSMLSASVQVSTLPQLSLTDV
jgi:hypothetical protein